MMSIFERKLKTIGLHWLFISLFLSFMSCQPRPRMPEPQKDRQETTPEPKEESNENEKDLPAASVTPTIRVGILEGRSRVDFNVDDSVTFTSGNGSFALRGGQGGGWKVEIVEATPAEFRYHLAVGTTKIRNTAEDIVHSLKRKGLDAHVEKLTDVTDFSIPYAHNSVYQAVLDKKFTSEIEAKSYQENIRPKSNSEIVKIPVETPGGVIRFTNLDSNYSFDSAETVNLSAERVLLANVEVGSGFHWETTEHRTFGGTLRFLLDSNGLITVVNELPLEEYLKGVVPSEMPVSFPYEALKAQAIAARVEAISKVGLRHPFQPFDLCDEVHCQVFSGLSRNAERSDMAVESTRGIFMIYKDEIIEAFYAGVCGGHTENNENVWLIDAKPYLRGVLDKRGNRLSTSLETESNVKKWIDRSPDVYCNASRQNAPKSVSYSKKYFRWQVSYDRSDLEEIIRAKTGENFGNLLDLVPLKRGVSGRLIDLQVVGTRKRFVINKELSIRQALSRKTLFSACFYVKKRGRSGGQPAKFTLKGAGWGHGVGMCQIGAAMMANSGQKFDEILTHYYRGIFLEKLYN